MISFSLQELRGSGQWHIKVQHGASCRSLPPTHCLVFHVFIAIPAESHHVSPLKLRALPRRSALQRPKSCKLTTSALTDRCISQEISRLEIVSFGSFHLVSVGSGSQRMSTRQVTEDRLYILEPCNITAERGSLSSVHSTI